MIESSLQRKIIWFLKSILLISSFKNIIYWRYPLLNSGEFFHYPIIPFFSEIPGIFFMSICAISMLGALFVFFNKSLNIFAYVLIFSGVTNLILQLSDYLALHHDMYLSGMAFIALGYYFLRPTSSRYGIVLGITASTYLVSGIHKINPDFLNGSITADVIERSSRFFYGDAFSVFVELSVFLSIFAMLVEITVPFILILGNMAYKKISVLITLPFHFGILATGTGTIYNLTYPLLFWFLIYFHPSLKQMQNHKLDSIHSLSTNLAVIVSYIYFFYLCSMLPSLFNAVMRRLV